jgi:uroporphyrinogen decarboxylase
MVLLGPEDAIRREVSRTLADGGDQHLILNVGHGVIQQTPEESVGLFCQLARESQRARTPVSSFG